MNTISKETELLRHDNALLLEKTNEAIDEVRALKKLIKELLDPPQPTHLSIKQVSMVLDRTHGSSLLMMKKCGVEPIVTANRKSYRYEDVAEVARVCGITLKKLAI